MPSDQNEPSTHSATYCPEDDKLRLYVGWLPRPEYDALMAEGWTATPKQNCDFVAVWTPARRDTAIGYAGIIEDEDMGPEERAVDRADRFAVYREKRTDEATGHADRFDAGPAVHGFQSFAKAVRSADRHDRIAGRAVDAWSKAEYWQRRTAGVISHALHKAAPGVRMGRIKKIEAELRGQEKGLKSYREEYDRWVKLAGMDPGEKRDRFARFMADQCWSDFQHPRTETKASLSRLLSLEADPISPTEAISLWLSKASQPVDETDWTSHLKLRLAYEHQMLGQQGGVAELVEMVVGGFIYGRRIHKVNRSVASKRIVSVNVLAEDYKTHNRWGTRYPEGIEGPIRFHTTDVERVPVGAYRAPTAEELAAFESERKADKAARPKVFVPPLINPTDEDAQRLQALWNEETSAELEAGKKRRGYGYSPDFEPQEVRRVTQADYSNASGGTYSHFTTVPLVRGGAEQEDSGNLYSPRAEARRKAQGDPVCKVRRCYGKDWMAKRVIVITDKPQKPFPVELWSKAGPVNAIAEQPAPEVAVEPEPVAAVEVAFPTGPVTQAELCL